MKIKVKITAILMFFAAITFNACSGSGLDTTIPKDLINVEAPQLNPGTGTFSSDIMIKMTTATAGALIYYTKDNTPPSESSLLYSSQIGLAGNGAQLTIRCIAILGGVKSVETIGVYHINYEQASTPQFSPAGDTYTVDTNVELTCLTANAAIHYTLNGDEPTDSSAVYSTPIQITGNGTEKTIKTIAIKTGFTNSTIAAATYKISYPIVSGLVFNPTAGIYSNDTNITITAESGAQIYYTTDGTAPSELSATYTAPISVAGNKTSKQIRAIGVKPGRTTSELSGTFTINYLKVSTPQFSSAGGTYPDDKMISITVVPADAQIYYTTNGSTPDENSTPYTGPVDISGDGTSLNIKAIAVKSGMETSSVAEASYTINYPFTATPVFSITSNTLVFQTEYVYIESEAGATIYYTTNGDTPTTSSTQYTGIIRFSAFNGVLNIKAIAVKAQRKNSPVVWKNYYVDSRTVYLLGNRYTLDSYHQYTVYTTFIWINGVITNLTPYSRGNALTVSNGHYYIAGTISGTGAYWIDGVYTLLTRGNFGPAVPRDIAVNSGTVYTVGSYDARLNSSDPSKYIACVWVNNVKTDLETVASEATGIAISGSDVYISGNFNNTDHAEACYWKNGVRTSLSSGSSEATGIVVNGSDVYISGYTYGAFGTIACYWKNGIRTDLYDVTKFSITTGIDFSGGDLYISGSYKGPYLSTEATFNCIWKNVPGTFAFGPYYYDNISAFKSVSTSFYIVTNYWFENKYYYSLGGPAGGKNLDFYQLDNYKAIFVVE